MILEKVRPFLEIFKEQLFEKFLEQSCLESVFSLARDFKMNGSDNLLNSLGQKSQNAFRAKLKIFGMGFNFLVLSLSLQVFECFKF